MPVLYLSLSFVLSYWGHPSYITYPLLLQTHMPLPCLQFSFGYCKNVYWYRHLDVSVIWFSKLSRKDLDGETPSVSLYRSVYYMSLVLKPSLASNFIKIRELMSSMAFHWWKLQPFDSEWHKWSHMDGTENRQKKLITKALYPKFPTIHIKYKNCRILYYLPLKRGSFKT